MQRRSLLQAAAAAPLIAATPFVRAQGSLQKFKFNLGWKFEASGAGFLLAQQRGYYKDAGLDVTIDTGNGSAGAISLVAGGAYDAASAELLVDRIEAIVAETLTPIAYVGPAQGTPRADWALKSPAELLDLKICDPAMGSGAFLVQACRWLADRLVEAWAQAEAQCLAVGIDGQVVDADANIEPLPRETEARTIVARLRLLRAFG